MNRRKFLASTGQTILGGIVLSHGANALTDDHGVGSISPSPAGRQRQLFDASWKFHHGDISRGEDIAIDDSLWQPVELPHDWSIFGPFSEDNPSGPHGAFLPCGVGWYRKTFMLPPGDRGKSVEIEFDGIYMNSDVWLNGHHLGRRPNGFVSFSYDLTPRLHVGNQSNVLAVKVDNSLQPNCRWYSGSGIYRHVWLTTAAAIRVDHWGTFIHTPTVSATSAEVEISTRIRNDRGTAATVLLLTKVINDVGEVSAEVRTACSARANAVTPVIQQLRLSNPRLWSLDEPVLYTAVSQVFEGESLTDEYRTTFGVRSARFDPNQGFLLNEQPVLLKGVCIHHDLGALGAAFHEPAMERRLQILKRMGCNAIRMSHNPPAPQLLDLCDQLGFLVIDEAFDEWRVGKEGIPYGYHLYFDEWAERDLVSMIERDRNHPSIILWSLGNEIPEKGKPEGVATALMLVNIAHRCDSTRPTTSAINFIESANKSGFADVFDVVGYNGGGGSSFMYGVDHQSYPLRKIYGSEAPHTAQTRGTYISDENHCSSYDTCFIRMSSEGACKLLQDHPFVAGNFRWTGIDYLGEPIPHKNYHIPARQKLWPARSSDAGVLDTCGFEKDIYYFYQSQWAQRPMVHILPHWNWTGREGQPVFVWCYTNCDAVELFLNERSLGVQHTMTAADYHLSWEVPYAPGLLRAVGMRAGKHACTEEVQTASAPAKLSMTCESTALHADGRDLAHLSVEVTDSAGVMAPNADNLVEFDVEGEGCIVGVDNGDPLSHYDFRGSSIPAFRGKCMMVVRSTTRPGILTIRARSQGLGDAVFTLGSR